MEAVSELGPSALSQASKLKSKIDLDKLLIVSRCPDG